MNEAARRAPRLHRWVHGAAAAIAATVALLSASTGSAGTWTATVAAIAAVLLAAEAVTCRCLLEDGLRRGLDRARERIGR